MSHNTDSMGGYEGGRGEWEGKKKKGKKKKNKFALIRYYNENKRL